MTTVTAASLQRLMEQSLIAWRVLGRVKIAPDDALLIDGLGRVIRIVRAPSDMPFRWMVAIDGRQRPALSIAAVLRHVRGALDPTYEKARVRIAPVPLDH